MDEKESDDELQKAGGLGNSHFLCVVSLLVFFEKLQ